MAGKYLESSLKTCLDRSLRLHRFCADVLRCLLKGSQKDIDIHVGEFLGLIRLRVAILLR